MQILNLEKGLFFQMGKGQNWRVIHPDMGARQITLNHSIHAPGHEFPQHTHDNTEDIFVILDGGVSVRQGEIYTPVKAGEAVFVPPHEVHGTVNTTDGPARLISFQSPPDMALYRGERNKSSEETPKPVIGHRSAVQIISMARSGPVFGKPGHWRSVISPESGSRHLAMEYIRLGSGDSFTHEPINTEGVYVLFIGVAILDFNGNKLPLKYNDVIFVNSDDSFSLSQNGAGPTILIHCWALT